MDIILKVLVCIALLPTLFCSAQVNTTLNDFFLPGSQPGQSGSFDAFFSGQGCGCHAGYDSAVEPMYNWRGSMMSQSQRDPLYLAALKIANQDAEYSGDLCIRCHSPRGWLSGRSSATDGSLLTAEDREGIYCEFCHRAVKPSQIDVNPYPNNTEYTTNTYDYDQIYLDQLTLTDNLPNTSANGMYLIDNDETRRGPYTEIDAAKAPHNVRYSPFHSDAYFCGTCHDVSNPVFELKDDGTYVLNTLNTPSPSFDPYKMFPVERTFSEWKMSDYNSPGGVYAPQFGGNKNYVSTCQDCHLRDVSGQGCKLASVKNRNDLPLHDMTGGNTFIPVLLPDLYSGEVDAAALNSGISRATYMLQNAATLEYENPVFQTENILLRVKVTNETGHKLPSGYPEGRRIWLNVIAYDDDAKEHKIFESGAYDNSTGILTQDAQVKIYEIEPGNSGSPSFNFVLNNEIIKDNRIPPRGFTNANFEAIQSPPVGYTYDDGVNWDYTDYILPLNTKYFTVNLYYQSTSKEYIEFLRDTEKPQGGVGQAIYDLWNENGKSAPVLMETLGNTIPLPVELVSFTAQVISNSVKLNWRTETEINNYGFDIERSNEEGIWSRIGFVQGYGNSNSPKDYSFEDNKPFGQKISYRLKQIDNDGSFDYSAVVSVRFNTPNKLVLYQNYPNPFNGTTTIGYELPAIVFVDFRLYDCLGNTVEVFAQEVQEPGAHYIQVSSTNLASGIYFYRLVAGNVSFTKRMILLK